MLDCELQKQILEVMRDAYPGHIFVFDHVTAEENAIIANLYYLEEHGLCEAGLHPNLSGSFSLADQKITAAGIDFLADDGGLSSILGTITIKIHADTIRELIASKIDASGATAEEKGLLKSQLSKLPEAVLTAATNDLVRSGLDHLPNAMPWLYKLFGLL